MLGAIAGDIIGSAYEMSGTKSKDFPLFSEYCRFTDDTVLTIAVADAILHDHDYVTQFKAYYQRYPRAGYGGHFKRWAGSSDREPYNSWGNGSAMRVSAVGFAFDRLDQVLQEAERSAVVTHNHPEGIKGAQATAAAIFLGRTVQSKREIKANIETTFGYDLSQTLDEIRPSYEFDMSCQGTVPQAVMAFLESTDFEDAIRNAISLGGDSDTLACITGGIAQAFYGGVPEAISEQALTYLDERLRSVTVEFMTQFNLD
jgi:ADP-ribosylglycohydrolase